MIEETDASKLTPKQWDAWMNHAFLPQTAEKYGACRADIHELWKVYLRTNHLKASALLKDGVHLNGHGEWLMAEFIKSYLAPLPSKPNYDPMNEARGRTVPPAASLGHNVATYGFDGMRVDLIFGPGTHGALEVMIDGKRPSAIPELYVFTRVSPFPSSNWPILLKAGSVSPLLKEEWSLRIGHATEDGKNCHFELAGAITGDDGEGWSTNRFVSNSRRVVIEPDDWNLAYCAAVFMHPIPEPFVATWRAVLLGTDWATPPEVKDGVERCLTLAQGLPPGRHTLELRGPNVDQSVRAVRAYRPPACAYPQGQ